jgi:hypothetical protein
MHFHVIPRYLDDALESKRYEELSLERRKELAAQLSPALKVEIADRTQHGDG